MLVACGKQRRWPAVIDNCTNCEDQDHSEITAALTELNDRAESPLISFSDAADQERFTIQLSFVDANVLQKEGEYTKNTRAGLATVYEDHCSVQLSKELHKDENLSYYKAVLWHELGHCAGLKHDEKPEEIMSAVTKKFSAYSEEIINRFINKIKGSAQF